MSANGNGAAEAVRDTIYRSCLLLDEEKWSDWLDLCDDGFSVLYQGVEPRDQLRHDVLLG